MRNNKEHKWFVLEGDNGTGKDTLADRFELDGWWIVSRDIRAVRACEQARQFSGMDFVNAFLDYNRLCSEIITETDIPAILVRYWPSTINGALADGIITNNKHEELLMKCFQEYCAPSAFIYLTCNFEERCDRVKKRGAVSAKDDMSTVRNTIYRSSARLCATHIPQWHSISSEMEPEALYEYVNGLVKGK